MSPACASTRLPDELGLAAEWLTAARRGGANRYLPPTPSARSSAPGPSGRQPQARRGAAHRRRARRRPCTSTRPSTEILTKATVPSAWGWKTVHSRRYRSAGGRRMVARDPRIARHARPPVRPVKGQMVALRMDPQRRCCAMWCGRRASISSPAATAGCSSARRSRRAASTPT